MQTHDWFHLVYPVDEPMLLVIVLLLQPHIRYQIYHIHEEAGALTEDRCCPHLWPYFSKHLKWPI